MSDRIIIKKEHEKDIQAYIDYCRIVGVDDGGKMFNEKEFEEYKKKVESSRRNHLYVYWTNNKGVDCKAIGPESMCFCGHRFKMHNFDNVKTKKVDCKDSKCKCRLYEYVPVHGSNDVKCLCKHSYSLHDNIKRHCTKPGCTCNQFGSKFTCNCGTPFDDHVTTIETREERMKRGKNVDPSWMSGNMTAGIGGLNSFTSMVGDVYEMEYKKLMNKPEDSHLLPQDFDDKLKIGYDDSNEKQMLPKIKGQSNEESDIMFMLFNTPNRWQEQGKSDDKLVKISGKMSNSNLKMINKNFK